MRRYRANGALISQLLHRGYLFINAVRCTCSASCCAVSVPVASLYDSSLIALARLVLIRLPTDALRKQRLNLLRTFLLYCQCWRERN